LCDARIKSLKDVRSGYMVLILRILISYWKGPFLVKRNVQKRAGISSEGGEFEVDWISVALDLPQPVHAVAVQGSVVAHNRVLLGKSLGNEACG